MFYKQDFSKSYVMTCPCTMHHSFYLEDVNAKNISIKDELIHDSFFKNDWSEVAKSSIINMHITINEMYIGVQKYIRKIYVIIEL